VAYPRNRKYTLEEDELILSAIANIRSGPRSGIQEALLPLVDQLGRSISGLLSRATVLRNLRANGVSSRPRRTRRQLSHVAVVFRPAPERDPSLPVSAPHWMRPITKAQLMAGR